MKLSFCDVTSGNVLWRHVLCEQKGWHMGRRVVHPQGEKTWLCLGSAVEGLDWHWVGYFSPPLHK